MQYVAKTIHITDAVDVPIVTMVMSSPCSSVSVIEETEVDISVRSCEPFNVLKDETVPLVIESCGVGVAVLLFLGQSLSTKILRSNTEQFRGFSRRSMSVAFGNSIQNLEMLKWVM
jgi:hypothetical protein